MTPAFKRGFVFGVLLVVVAQIVKTQFLDREA